MTKEEVIAAVKREIELWNERAQDLFKLNQTDENLNFSGIVRFYYKSRTVGYSSCCMKTESGWNVKRIINELFVKFSEIINCSSNRLALFECHHGQADKQLNGSILPLFIQLRWISEGLPEGHFVLKQISSDNYEEDDYSYIDLPPKVKFRKNQPLKSVVQKFRLIRRNSKIINYSLSEEQISEQISPTNPLNRALNDTQTLDNNISPGVSPSKLICEDSKDYVTEMNDNDVYFSTTLSQQHTNFENPHIVNNSVIVNPMGSEYDRLNQSMGSLYSELSSSDDSSSKRKGKPSGANKNRHFGRHHPKTNRSESLENLQQRSSGFKTRPLPKVDQLEIPNVSRNQYSGRELSVTIPEEKIEQNEETQKSNNPTKPTQSN